MSITPDAVREEIRENSFVVGNPVKTAAKIQALASVPLYVDSNGSFAAGGFPFAVPLYAGALSTSASVMDVQGSATGSANELMHLTLVAGANATAVIAGYYRIVVTDAAGVITTGNYYAPFYTLG